MLKQLCEKRIFSVELMPDNKELVFYEECDGYFSMGICKADLAQLLTELQDIYGRMVE